MALIATLSGAQTCVDIATFARAKLPLLRRSCAWPMMHPATIPSAACSRPSTPTPSKTLSTASWPASLKLRTTRAAAEPTAPASSPWTANPVRRRSRPPIPPRRSTSSRPGPPSALVPAQPPRPQPQRGPVPRGRSSPFSICRAPGVTADALHGSRATAAAILEGQRRLRVDPQGNRGPLHDAARDLLANLDPQSCPHDRDRAWPMRGAVRLGLRGAGLAENTAFPGCAPLPASMAAPQPRMRPTRRPAVKSATWRSLAFSLR